MRKNITTKMDVIIQDDSYDTLKELIKTGKHLQINDFDDHLNDIEIQWPNTDLTATLSYS